MTYFAGGNYWMQIHNMELIIFSKEQSVLVIKSRIIDLALIVQAGRYNSIQHPNKSEYKEY